MDLYWGWPLTTIALMFVTYWVSRVTSFASGFDEGQEDGIELGSRATARVVMEYMRDKYDLRVSDIDIQEVVDGISITQHEVSEDG